MHRDRHAYRDWKAVAEPRATVRASFSRWRWPNYWWVKRWASRRLRYELRRLVFLLLLLGGTMLGLASGVEISDVRLFLAQASKSLPFDVRPPRYAAAPAAPQLPVVQSAPPPARAGFEGYATIIDGDSVEIRGRRIRLDGIDAPEGRQICNREGYVWACGADSAAALAHLVGGRRMSCNDNGRDRFDRILAHCWVGNEDLGAWMVREGLAVAYTRYSNRYAAEEAFARRERRGLWASRFENPEDWRRRNPR